MPESSRRTRRRNARTAYESGAERSDFGRRGGDARPRRQAASRRGGTLAGTAPSAAAAAPIAGGRNSRFGRRPRFADPLAWAGPAPVRRRDASSFEKPRRASPFLVRTWRGQRHFRWKLRASAVPVRGERRLTGQRRRRPRRRRRPAQGVEDQNKSGDCRARARPLMSLGGTVVRGGAQPRATGGQRRLVGRRTMARFLHR